MWEPGAQAKVTHWNQINPAWPNAPLKLFGPGADSGTFDYFTDAINGKEKASRGDFTASEDDNVLVQGVSRDVNAIGYFGLAYYVENKDKLKAVPIVNKGTSKGVSPSLETVMDGTYQPLARPIFIYVSDKALAKPEVKEFIEYYIKHAPKLVKEVGYVPLSNEHYQQAARNFASKKLGTGFGGKSEVGVRVEELLAREGKL
jgi:phosphate transport system substrate-binding protein